jgi:hypothetical protein
MRQKWRKLGRIFFPNGSIDWMRTHASVPIAEHIDGNFFRIYFSSRNYKNQSHTGAIVVDITRPQDVISLSSAPVLSPGRLGEFDDSGAMASWLVAHGDQSYLYYIGWNIGGTVPFRNSIGLAIRNINGNFSRYASGPILDRNMIEPHFVGSCCVIPFQEKWLMWYLSCTDWSLSNGSPQHRYHIKYAESNDGITWNRNGIVAIDYINDSEIAISRPSVIRGADYWQMWFSYRGSAYKIGYAESEDGIVWKRNDSNCGINTSESGWDSEMIEYPFVFDHAGARYMLYNGNGYGETGFGLAILEAG